MSKSALTIATIVLAATTLTSTANAGGVRLGFGFPLGSFVAKSYQGSSQHVAPSYQKRQAKPAYAAQRAPKKAAAPKVRVAATPEPRKIKKPAPIKVATAAPVAETKPEVKQVTIEKKEVETAALPPQTEVKADITPVEETKTVEVEDNTKTEENTAKVCRKFSAIVGGLVEIPCE